MSRARRCFIHLPLLLLCASHLQADTKIYRFVDPHGKTQFTDRPAHDGFVRLVKTWKGWTEIKTNPDYTINKRKYLPIIENFARQHEIPSELIVAIIHAESHFNPNSVSRSGAVGLMQLMPSTATRFGVYDRHNPTQNIQGGVKYLRKLMTMFGDDLDLVLAAYNAGENAVKKHGNRVPPYGETQRYIKKVRELYSQYLQNLL